MYMVDGSEPWVYSWSDWLACGVEPLQACTFVERCLAVRNKSQCHFT